LAREPGRIGIPELLVGVPFPVLPLEIMRFRGAGARAVVDQPRRHADSRRLPSAAASSTPLSIRSALSRRRWPSPSRWPRCQRWRFALTKRQLREPVLERIHVGASLDAAVQTPGHRQTC